jgi:phosphohistidine phosphatase SixA
MKIYLVRHGEALSTEADPERALSSKGKTEVQRAAEYVKRLDLHVPQILHSLKLRAQQTAEIFGAALGAPLSMCPTLLDSEASVEPVMSMLPSLTDGTMLVGHMPMLAKLVSAMVLHDEHYFPITNYSPGTVVCLETYDALRWIINWILPVNLVA